MKQMSKAQFLFKNKMEYTTIPKEYLRDKNLSIKAKGLLTIIYSLPDEWEYSIKGLAKTANLTEKTLSNILREIIEEGYIWRDQLKDSRGRFYYTYLVHYEKIKKEWL